DIYSIEDLAQLIYDLRAINPAVRIGVKLVSGAGVGIIAAGVAKAGADVITISGFDGGTGASPLTSIKNTGLPWEIGLREAHRALIQTGFRGRVRLRVDGGFKFGRDVIIAALLGANEFGFGTAALLAIGCVMARQCHLNTCPAGIATQDETMRTRFNGTPEMVMAYFRGVATEVRERLAALGARSLDEIVGAVQFLAPRTESATAAVGALLASAPEPPARISENGRDAVGVHGELIRRFSNLLAGKPQLGSTSSTRSRAPRRNVFAIANSDRTVGAHLSGEILRSTSFEGLKDGIIDCEFRGVAGQSFGAFLISGLRFRLRGEANDYAGKSLSGGTIAISGGVAASRRGDVLAGNTVLYGATSGELYVAGRAGERFAVRNSGALAVVEGVGDHGCEYMTAGVVLILGDTGQNLCSGMTGGLVYALDRSVAKRNYNREFVRCPAFDDETAPSFAAPAEDVSGMPAWSEVDDDQEDLWLRRVLREHVRLTGSPRGRRMLNSAARVPLLRLEPVRLPCSIGRTWEPILTRLEQQEMAALGNSEKSSGSRTHDPAVFAGAAAASLQAERNAIRAASANSRAVPDASADSLAKPH
ncbi:MAG TPA: glutamate synthase-related protein, partial [Candidatus Acidoferrales bacterium]|nr:glutamate synthase-related protein [Candidatus Acidoferrales bacterium]